MIQHIIYCTLHLRVFPVGLITSFKAIVVFPKQDPNGDHVLRLPVMSLVSFNLQLFLHLLWLFMSLMLREVSSLVILQNVPQLGLSECVFMIGFRLCILGRNPT